MQVSYVKSVMQIVHVDYIVHVDPDRSFSIVHLECSVFACSFLFIVARTHHLLFLVSVCHRPLRICYSHRRSRSRTGS